MARVAGSVGGLVPSSRIETWNMAVYFNTATEQIVGPFAPLVYLLEVFYKLLAEDTKFRYMHATDWRRVNLKLHLAIQGDFSPGPVDAISRLHPMEDLLERLRKSKIIHNHKVPPEIQGTDTGPDGDQPARVTGRGRNAVCLGKISWAKVLYGLQEGAL